jgi:hypothetical protein
MASHRFISRNTGCKFGLAAAYGVSKQMGGRHE